MQLDGKIAIVTGASQGIGKAIALHLASEGAHVVVDYVGDPAAAEDVVMALQRAGRDALAFEADVSNPAQAQSLVDAALAKFGRLDILINNAGIQNYAPLLSMKLADWQRVMDVNLKGVFLCSQAAAKPMSARGGCIVNITSICGSMPFEGYAHYCASKAALNMLTKAMALELACHRIRVNGVAPGTVDTEMTQQAARDEPTLVEDTIAQTPLRKLVTAEDIAQAVLFLCGESTASITGTILTVDAGYTLKSRPQTS